MIEEQWPPAPIAARAAKPEKVKPEVPVCPACGRKLLSVISILCNWCGAPIEDEEYQARAAQERAALDAAEKERLEKEIRENAALGVRGRLKKVAKETRGTAGPFEGLKL